MLDDLGDAQGHGIGLGDPRHQHGAQHRGKESTPHHHGVPSCWNSLPSWSGSSGNRTIACFANGAKTTSQRTYAHNRETRRRNRKEGRKKRRRKNRKQDRKSVV